MPCRFVLLFLMTLPQGGAALGSVASFSSQSGEWSIEGGLFEQKDDPSDASNLRCVARTELASIQLFGDGRSTLVLTGEESANVTSLSIDGVRYEVKPINRFSIRQDRRQTDEEEVLLFRGHIAVRASKQAPWLNIVTLLSQLVRGRTLTFTSHDIVDDRPTSPRTYEINLDGLATGLTACQRSVFRGSDAFK